MASRKVSVGFLRFRDVDENSRIAFFGEEIDVHEDDLERFDSLNVEASTASAVDESGEEPDESALSQADVDAAVQTALDEKDAELAEARKAVEDKAAEVAKEIADLATAKAEFEKSQAEASKAEPAKPAAAKSTAKQS